MLTQHPSPNPQPSVQSHGNGNQDDRHHQGWFRSFSAKKQGGHWRWRIVVSGLLLIGTLWQCIGAWQDSQTTDEAVHLVAGYSYLRTNDHRLNPEHPPLIKILAALPLLGFNDLNFSTTQQSWVDPQQWQAGADLIYGSFSDPQMGRWILFFGRIPMILVWLALAILLWWWSKKLWGPLAGVLTLGLFVFDPNFLGHGHLITTDVGMCLAFVATWIAVERFCQAPSWGRAWALGVIFALAQFTKFSAVLLILLVPLVILIRALIDQQRLPWMWVRRVAVTILIATPLIGLMVYGGDTAKLSDTPLIKNALAERVKFDADPNALSGMPPFIKSLYHVTDPDTQTGRTIRSFLDLSLPGQAYLHGLLEAANHDFWGHSAFLLGKTGTQGWWYYFPVALAVKFPTLTFALFLVAVVLASVRLVRTSRWKLPPSFWTLVFPALAYLGWSMTSSINIGVRHIFPFMVFVYVWVGWLTTIKIPSRWKYAAVALILTVSGIVSVRAWPHTLAYFAGWTGGTERGQRMLLDSNYDWNQDAWRLRDYLDRTKPGSFHLAMFGSLPQNTLFPERKDVLTDPDIASGQKPSGLYVVSAGLRFDPNAPLRWLESYEPVERIGSTLFVYDFR